jgi:outer membrane receptor protein involved in Fe transport
MKPPQIAAALALLLAYLPLAASADAPADLADLGLDDDFELDLDRLDITDDLALLAAEDVVISASRRLQRIEESPSAITVLTREQIRSSGYDNLADLMRLVPGADVYRISQAHVAVGLRGRSTWAGDRMLVLVDGRDLALHMWGQPQWMGMPFDVDSIERIEVIRGPGSTLYGANALQGVVNIVTRAPADAPRVAEATAGVAGANTASADARSHGRVGDWGYWVSAGYDRRAPYARPDEVAYESLRGRLRLDWDGGDEVRARVEAGVVQMNGLLVSYVGAGDFSSFWPYLSAAVSLPRSEILAVVDWNDTRMEMDLGLILPDDLSGEPLAVAPSLAFPTRSAELTAHHTFDLFEGNRLMVGGSARAIHHMPGILVRCPDVAPESFSAEDCVLTDVVEARLGLFVQDEWYLTNDVLLNVGARLDHNSLTDHLGLSPRAALVWRFQPGQSLRLAYGRAYRKPSFAETDLSILVLPHEDTPDDIARRLQHLFTRVGRRSLRNEHVDSIELGLRARLLDERLVAMVDVYGARFANAIVGVSRNLGLVDGFGGVPQIPRDAEVTFEHLDLPIWSYGGEVALTARPSPWLEISGAYVLDRLFEERVDPETEAVYYWHNDRWEPDHQIVGSVRLSSGGLKVGMDAIWMSRYLTETRHPVSALAPTTERFVGAATLVNGHLAYAVPLPEERRLEVGLSAINVLGQPYREVGAYDDDEGRALLGGEAIAPRARVYLRGRF